MKVMLVLFSLIFSYYCEYAQHNYRSLFDEKESTDLLNEVWEFGFNNPEEKEYLSDLFKEINSNTVVVKFYLCGLKDYEMLSAENDPGNNLKIVKDYLLLVNKSEDTVDAFGIYREFDNCPCSVI
ncbi:MAG: hypothetical protein KL787_09920 [Taibaiella sp.]|nr:hypothetical protein [Taibaiella sp.]